MTKREWMERETDGLLTVENETGDEEATLEWMAAMYKLFTDAFDVAIRAHGAADKAMLNGIEVKKD